VFISADIDTHTRLSVLLKLAM